MKAGCVLIDCKGLDLTDDTQQTITGLYKAMKKAIKSNKQLIACNCVWGSNSDAPLTPITFFAQEWSSTLIVGTASILNITVDNEDHVNVTNLTAGAAKAATRSSK